MPRFSAVWFLALILLAPGTAAQAQMPAQAPAQVIVRDIEMGEGDTAVEGARLVVQYVGFLPDGTPFDSSYDRGRPFDFTLGLGQVIQGWDLGIKGMRVGGRRELIVPPELAYGEKGAGTKVPPGATLRFEIELMKVEAATYTQLAPAALKALLGTGVTVVDIRPGPRQAETGTIAGAVSLPAFDEKGTLNRRFLAGLLNVVADKAAPVILIDDDGRRARYMGSFLTQNAGFTNLRGLDGGLTAWTGQGYRLEKR